ncbi:MAG: metal ABC transporter ATP-binding protein [Saprospiraceae bacterium]|jgi:ABC-type Mn2+/Zn2+ transport system ATPase subunit|nr:metal ABC transporter ATP-binding protein [Candidatus Vicinibacter proximus]MBL7822404.1 metal ABC transporter ATP-binding protein [Saprospiraceae bacterium]MCC6843156.1 metal ABC transporter ATP-binding protein [Saprospiraceae bacterium]HRG32054.1 metal ABC transporter ATP-binding protein [Saprospiraceae bacterium]
MEQTNYPIELKGVSVAYDHKRVLSNIYLYVEAQHIYGLIGPNGAGKSTLFKCILNQIRTNAGEIKLFGKPVGENITRIAYVPQKDEVDWQFPATVMDIVLMGRYPHKKWYQWINKEDKEKARAALEQLNMTHYGDRQIGELSGGQQQRVFLARALCQEADIFLMDEPFVGVDVRTEQRMIKILKQLASEGKTILVVHHDLDSVQTYFDKVIMINQKLIAFGDTSEVFTKENISATYSSQSHFLEKNF